MLVDLGEGRRRTGRCSTRRRGCSSAPPRRPAARGVDNCAAKIDAGACVRPDADRARRRRLRGLAGRHARGRADRARGHAARHRGRRAARLCASAWRASARKVAAGVGRARRGGRGAGSWPARSSSASSRCRASRASTYAARRRARRDARARRAGARRGAGRLIHREEPACTPSCARSQQDRRSGPTSPSASSASASTRPGARPSRRSCARATSRRSSLDVQQQVAAGAHVLDVNMGVPLTDEAELLARAIRLVQETRSADLHRLLDRRGARGRPRRLRGQGAGQLGDGRGRPHGARSCRWSSATARP